MKNFITTHLIVTLVCVFSALTIISTLLFSSYITRSVSAVVQKAVVEQRERLLNVAVRTDRIELDSESELIISDCERRQEFEDLLSRLNTLSRSDILTTQQLYSSCGLYYVERKDLLVSQLNREYEVYKELLRIAEPVLGRMVTPEEESDWGTVVSQEAQRASLLREQASVQAEIIRLLISGNLASNRPISDQVDRANAINQSLITTDSTVDSARSRLVAIHE
jgi:hypothetical protein